MQLAKWIGHDSYIQYIKYMLKTKCIYESAWTDIIKTLCIYKNRPRW